jgi:hypothetical protein
MKLRVLLSLCLVLILSAGSTFAQEIEVSDLSEPVVTNVSELVEDAAETNSNLPRISCDDRTIDLKMGEDITSDMLLSGITIVDSSGNTLDLLDALQYRFGDKDTIYLSDMLDVDEAVEYINALGKCEDIEFQIGLSFDGQEYPEYGYSSTWSVFNIEYTSSIFYTTHVQNVGWQEYATDGGDAGTEGLGLRLEGVKIYTDNPNLQVNYKTHVQNIGWQESASNDEMSGTEGLGLRLEAISISLSGSDADQYQVYYQVHAQNFGWLGIARNGEYAGTEGYGYRLEGLRVVILKNTDLVDTSGMMPYLCKSDYDGFNEQLFNRINQKRIENGVSPFTTTAGLQQAVQIRANELPVRFDNARPDGSWYTSALSQNGVYYSNAFEYIFLADGAPVDVNGFVDYFLQAFPELATTTEYSKMWIAASTTGTAPRGMDIICIR